MVALIAAHPDDETLGAGGTLAGNRGTVFVHVTDGAPRDMKDAAANGFSTCEAYAQARRKEFQDALSTGGITPAGTISLGYADQQASYHLAEIADELARLFDRLHSRQVLVHPYEGGHPDHDAVSFAAHAATQLLPGFRRPLLLEFTSYHSREGVIETGVFLDRAGFEAIRRLNPLQKARKQAMLACYRTQQETLRHFSTDEERFRIAPRYDFQKPPHSGPLFYELFPWGISGDQFRRLAHAASEDLGLC